MNQISYNKAARLAIAGIMMLLSSVVSAADKSSIVILNWSEYLNADLIAAFEKQYNATVKQVYFESDDARDKILLQTGGKGYDLIMVNGSTLSAYQRRGLIAPYNANKISNLKYIDERWRTAFEDAKEYGVPYFWGTLGIAYRADLVSKPITSWMDFFDPEDKLKGKLLIVKSSRDVIGMALKALGYSANSENREELLEAQQLLTRAKPYFSKFGYINLDETSSMLSGDTIAATVYGGDALNVAEHGENIAYVIPKEGGNIWVDYFSISSKAKNPDLAHAFINFMNEPKWAAVNAEEMYLASPNKAARKLLSKELINDSVIYPDESILSNSEFYKELNPRAHRLRSNIFQRITK